MSAVAGLRIAPERAVVMVVDIQERLAAAMDPRALARVEANVAVLLELARRLAIPVVATEQYPRGLGKTREPIEEALGALGGSARRVEKLEFSACECEAFGDVWRELAGERTQWIVTGMEAHVCVLQTARDLAARGATAHVPRDAVISRSEDNLRAGLEVAERAGAVVTSTEIVVFDALGRAGTEDFKAMSKLVR